MFKVLLYNQKKIRNHSLITFEQYCFDNLVQMLKKRKQWLEAAANYCWQ